MAHLDPETASLLATTVAGFRFAGVSAGMYPRKRLDVGLLVADKPAVAAGVFTQNQFRAAPVRLSAERIARGNCQAIIVNAGNANACTGRPGEKRALEMADGTAMALGIEPRFVCAASTGVIGVPLPIEKITGQLPALCSQLHEAKLADFATAILTTDKGPKAARVREKIGRHEVTVVGVTKGAGMIAPDMKTATTLTFVVTDVAIDRVFLRSILRSEAEGTLNRVTVDGDTSTNDSCFLLASGAAGNPTLRGDDRAGRTFAEMVRTVLTRLALQLVRDGEGATKVVRIEVQGAGTEPQATEIARRVANSPLVKTAIGGSDPNWGRVLMAVGNAGVALDPDKVDVHIGHVQVVSRGQHVDGDWEQSARTIMLQPSYAIRIHLHQGRASGHYHTCDFTHEYVRINADYRS